MRLLHNKDAHKKHPLLINLVTKVNILSIVESENFAEYRSLVYVDGTLAI